MNPSSFVVAVRRGCVQTFRRPQLVLPVFPLKVSLQHLLCQTVASLLAMFCVILLHLKTQQSGIPVFCSDESRLQFSGTVSPFFSLRKHEI